MVDDTFDDRVKGKGGWVLQAVKEGRFEELKPVWETEEDEQCELPVREGESREGDLGSLREMGGYLFLHANVRLEPVFDQVSPIHGGGDTILLLVLGSKMQPHLSGYRWVGGDSGGASGGGGDAVFVNVELKLLGAGGSHQTQGFGVSLLPDFDSSNFVVSGRLKVLWGRVSLSTIKVLPVLEYLPRDP